MESVMAAGISNHVRYQDSNYVSGSVMEKGGTNYVLFRQISICLIN